MVAGFTGGNERLPGQCLSQERGQEMAALWLSKVSTRSHHLTKGERTSKYNDHQLMATLIGPMTSLAQPPESLSYRGSGGPKIQSTAISPEHACMDHVYMTTRTIFTLVSWSIWSNSHYDNTNRRGTEYIFINFPQGYISFQASCHNLDYRIFDCLII